MSIGSTSITWLGHATFLFETPEGRRLLLDPWIEGNPSFPAEWRERLTGNIDGILVTHGHFDHINDLVAVAQSTGAPVACIMELGIWLTMKGVAESQVLGYNKGGTVEIGGIRATLTDARHSSGFVEDGQIVYMGTPCGFVLQFSDGCTIYHTGDTCIHSDMALIGELYRPNVAILPIGDFFTMGPFQAAHALRLIGAPVAIPEHYATFPLLHGSPDQLRAELGKLNLSTEVVALRPGESWAYGGR